MIGAKNEMEKGLQELSQICEPSYEAMKIINNRLLTTNNISDPKSAEPLTPNHLLTMKESVPLPPPGDFVREDLYTRKRRRRVQYLSEQFWHRWCKEYLTNISLRQQWHTSKITIQVGDIVIVKKQNIPRNKWKLAMVVNKEGLEGLVRRKKCRKNISSCVLYLHIHFTF